MNTMTEQEHTDHDALLEGRILRGSPENYRASIQYKGLAFRRDRNMASMTYEVKRARAMFDPNLAGGNGGWRCPAGTRRGGKITDQFGRNCGWGVARRIANTISDTGERLENALERRQARRTAKRNQRTARRIGKPAERIARRSSRRVDRVSERDRQITPRTRRGEGVPEVMDRTADEVLQGNFLANRRARRQARDAQRSRQAQAPRARRERRGAGVPERMDQAAQDVLEGRFMERRRKRRDSNRRRRERAQVERTTPAGGNRRPSGPTTPAGTTQRPTRRRGPRVDVGEPGSDRRQSADYMLAVELNTINEYWPRRLGNKPLTEKNIRAYVAEREQREGANPGYINTLRARERDWLILTGKNPHTKVNDLSPQVRKRINEGISRGEGRDRVPSRPRTPNNATPTPTPEAPELPELPEAPEAPKKPKPEAPEPEAPAGPRTSSRRIVGIEDVTDNVAERRRILSDVAAETRELNRNYERLRKPFVARDDDEGLKRLEGVLERAHDRLGKIADDKSKPVKVRYRARQKMRTLQDQKMKMREAREGIIERRRAAEEAANAPEAPSGPRTPRTPDTGNRTETFGLSKEERTKLDRFAESDRTARENQRREIERLIAANEEPEALIARRLNEANELLSDYKRDSEDSNADGPDRYIAAQSLEDVRAHRDALLALRDRRAANTPDSPTPEATPEPQTQEQPEGPELLVPDEAKQKELRAKFKERRDAILAKRNKIIGKYMKGRYGSGDAPWDDRTKNYDIKALSGLLDDVIGNDPVKQAEARAKVQEWVKQIYELPEFEGKDGTKFRTVVNATPGRDAISLSGSIQAYDEGRQMWVNIGDISRTLHVRKKVRDKFDPNFEPYVSNGLLKIRSAKYKNSGFASVYNPHAFTWLKASGFKRAAVGTAWDGKFVWGKMGYRESSYKSRALANLLEREIKKIREGGKSRIVNKRDADIIAALIDEARRRNYDVRAPQHAEYLMAMSNRDQAKIKGWFTKNAPFDSGTFYFDEIPDDPRK
jgi:hypothetical protein